MFLDDCQETFVFCINCNPTLRTSGPSVSLQQDMSHVPLNKSGLTVSEWTQHDWRVLQQKLYKRYRMCKSVNARFNMKTRAQIYTPVLLYVWTSVPGFFIYYENNLFTHVVHFKLSAAAVERTLCERRHVKCHSFKLVWSITRYRSCRYVSAQSQFRCPRPAMVDWLIVQPCLTASQSVSMSPLPFNSLSPISFLSTNHLQLISLTLSPNCWTSAGTVTRI